MTVASARQDLGLPLEWLNVSVVMKQHDQDQSGVMARLTLSALERASDDPSCWGDPVVYRALLVSGLSVLTEATRQLQSDLNSSRS